MKQMVSRIQILVSLFIEAGTPLDLDEDASRWTVFLLYKREPAVDNSSQASYVFAGYCTVYRFFLYKPPTPPSSPPENGSAVKEDLDLGDGNFDISKLPCRTRISQFIILPPFQGKGNGRGLYSAIYKEYLKHPQTVEITVESPNEAFDVLRDVADLNYLRRQPEFTSLKINTAIKLPKDGVVPRDIIDQQKAEALRRKLKIAPRQFSRLVELQLMSVLPTSIREDFNLENVPTKVQLTREQQHQYNLWKLLVKTRIYRQNKDVLSGLEVSSRTGELNKAAGDVQFEYSSILALVETRQKQADSTASSSNGKHKLIEAVEEPASKKARVEDA
jgi:histone acetyltransferase 1